MWNSSGDKYLERLLIMLLEFYLETWSGVKSVTVELECASAK